MLTLVIISNHRCFYKYILTELLVWLQFLSLIDYRFLTPEKVALEQQS